MRKNGNPSPHSQLSTMLARRFQSNNSLNIRILKMMNGMVRRRKRKILNMIITSTLGTKEIRDNIEEFYLLFQRKLITNNFITIKES
jgi:uncharacterized protein (UPF0332 family)